VLLVNSILGVRQPGNEIWDAVVQRVALLRQHLEEFAGRVRQLGVFFNEAFGDLENVSRNFEAFFTRKINCFGCNFLSRKNGNLGNIFYNLLLSSSF
jgi:hypothetical protein